MTDETFKTRSGKTITIFGDPQLLTMDRMQSVSEHFDSDPRIASVSLYPTSITSANQTFLRATAPAGCLIAVTQNDLFDHRQENWATAASNKGLWHDWYLSTSRDIAKAETLREPSELDQAESQDPSSSHHHHHNSTSIDPNAMSLTVDVTWLGEHETGAQVLTTAAIAALANQERITAITLSGKDELPTYARHLTDHPKVTLNQDNENAQDQTSKQSDILWYPNQIDQRVNIDQARVLGKRVVTTYLDLIAYDIPRYHASPEAHAAYRAMQRKIALSVDGITTISKDVAKRLYQETPRLDHKRIQAIPLGLDHITQESTTTKPKDFNSTRDFILVLGNDFKHKNREFAIQVWEELLNQGHTIDLVLAGLHVKSSSSKDEEKVLIKKHVNLRGQIHTLGHVTSQERAWLLSNAKAALYPSSAEGFGLVPYEAAAMNTPSTFAAFGPLKEISQLTTLPTDWDKNQFAQDLGQLLESEAAAQQRVNQLTTVINELIWEVFANQLTDFFAKIAELPTVPTAALGSTSTAESAALAQVLSSKSWKLTAPLRKFTGK
jgi:glycosyltransferase involved in cell wall biosynthesis